MKLRSVSFQNVAIRIALGAACFCTVLSCESTSTTRSSESTDGGPKHLLQTAGGARGRFRSESMSLADTYASLLAQPLDKLRSNERADVALWALETKIATASGSFTNAANVNEVVGFLDMVTFICLKRAAVERYWLPEFVKQDDVGLLHAYVEGERLAWEAANRLLSRQQIGELRTLIDAWIQKHPEQLYVSHVRFSEFAAERGITESSPQSKLPGSVFSLFYIDPLANLDPLSREMIEFRNVTERIVYLMERMPMILSWSTELALARSLQAPSMTKFVENTGKFADATREFAQATAGYPDKLTAERQAAVVQIAGEADELVASLTKTLDIQQAKLSDERKAAVEQVAGEVDRQRAALLTDVDAQQAKLSTMLADVKGIVADAHGMVDATRVATTQTLQLADTSAAALIDRVFRYACILIVLILVGTPLAIRMSRSRRGTLS